MSAWEWFWFLTFGTTAIVFAGLAIAAVVAYLWCCAKASWENKRVTWL